MLNPFHNIPSLCDAVMRGVIRTDVVTRENTERATVVIREEIKSLISGSTEEYENARAAVAAKTVHPNIAIGLVVVNSVRRIRTGA